MQSSFSHIQLNINFEHESFYKDLMTLLGWHEAFSGDGIFGYHDGTATGVSIWYLKPQADGVQHHDMVGVNHVGISVPEQHHVDEVSDFLKKNSVEALFDTPKHRPDFVSEEGKTYYQVMFESPDKVLFEIVYTGPKQ